VILDVAHNRQAAAILAENLGALASTGRNLVVAGMLKDKNHTALFEYLAPLTDRWYIGSLHNERGAEAGILVDALQTVDAGADIHRFHEVDDALDAVFAEAEPGDRVIVTGSFLTVGAAVRWLERNR
jgi:dihydrofolate synthase/folylpolyglutamate synthase